MYKITIERYTGKKSGAHFETLSELEAWRDSHIARDTWGRKERDIVKGSESYSEDLFLEEFIDNTDPINPVIMIKLKQEYVVGEIEDLSNEVATKNAKIQMNKNIRAKASELTLSSQDANMQATVSAWQLRATNPADYLDISLVALVGSGEFSPGDALDTEAKIVAYYKGLLITLDKFREQEIQDYIAIKIANS